MPTFSYQVRQSDGRILTGTHEAPTEREAIEALHEMGYWIVNLQVVTEKSGGVKIPFFDYVFGEANPRELALLYRQWATMVNAGLSVPRMLELSANGAKGRLGKALRDAVRRAPDGIPLTELLMSRRLLFGDVGLALLSAGEASGRLEGLLHRVADHYERKWRFRQAARKAMIYPMFLLGGVLFIPGLPILVLSGPDAYVKTTLIPTIISFAWLFILFFAFRFLIQLEGPGYVWSHFVLSMPVFGKNARRSSAARFIRAFADLFDAGLHPARALDVAARACGNKVIARKLLSAKPGLVSGDSITVAFERTGALPLTVLQMLRTGEESGHLPESLNKAAEYLEGDVEGSVSGWVAALPILFWLCVALPMIHQIFGMWGGYMNTVSQFMK